MLEEACTNRLQGGPPINNPCGFSLKSTQQNSSLLPQHAATNFKHMNAFQETRVPSPTTQRSHPGLPCHDLCSISSQKPHHGSQLSPSNASVRQSFLETFRGNSLMFINIFHPMRPKDLFSGKIQKRPQRPMCARLPTGAPMSRHPPTKRLPQTTWVAASCCVNAICVNATAR